MFEIKIYKCESCGKEFKILNDYSSYCRRCGSKDIKLTNKNNNNYELYNVKSGYTVD